MRKDTQLRKNIYLAEYNSSFIMIKISLFIIAVFLLIQGYSQAPITRDIKSFGAKGDGKTNDHAAFVIAAAFFNQRGGNGKLLISRGIYIVGKQLLNQGEFTWQGQDVLHFTSVKNLIIEGVPGAVLKYSGAMKYGSFDPATSKYTAYAAVLRCAHLKNTTFKFTNATKGKGYYINDCCEAFNHDGGGNKTVYVN